MAASVVLGRGRVSDPPPAKPESSKFPASLGMTSAAITFVIALPPQRLLLASPPGL